MDSISFKVKSIKNNRSEWSHTLGWATVSFTGFGNHRFKIVYDGKHSHPVVYSFCHREGESKKWKDNIKLEPALMAEVEAEILKKYVERKNKIKNKKQNKFILVAFPLRLLFHFYAKKKDDFTVFRVWMVSRYLSTNSRSGWALVAEVAKITALKPEYIRRLCRRSNLFRGVTTEKIYYVSTQKMMKSNQLNASRYGLYRYEELNARLLSNFRSNRRTAGYICKCYAEKDLQKGGKWTYGRISLQKMAEVFQVCSKTIWSILHLAHAKIKMNKREYPNKTISGEFSEWLTHNMDTRPDDRFNRTIEDGPCSFYYKMKGGQKVLMQNLPSYYKFTGHSQVLKKPKRGNVLTTSRQAEGQKGAWK